MKTGARGGPPRAPVDRVTDGRAVFIPIPSRRVRFARSLEESV